MKKSLKYFCVIHDFVQGFCMLAVIAINSVIAYEAPYAYDIKVAHDHPSHHHEIHEDHYHEHESSHDEHAESFGREHESHDHEHVDYHSHPQYKFEYGIKDPKTGDHKSQWEIRDGDVVKGQYTLDEADGTHRVVEYSSDKKNGFNAIVKKIGHAHHAHHH